MPPKKRRPNRQQQRKRQERKQEEMRSIAADYGWSMAVFEEFPALYKVFKTAIDNDWSESRFVAEIQDTQWFKQHSDTWRQATYLQLTDPKTYKQRVDESARKVHDLAGSLGISISTAQVREWGEQAMKFGWDQSHLQKLMSKSVNIMGKHSSVGGSLAETQSKLEGLAFDNAVNISKPTMQTWLRQIVRGNATPQEYEQYIKKMAAAKFPNWRKEIEAGVSVAQLAEPYRQTMAELLEVNPTSVRLDDRKIRTALSTKDKDGNWSEMSMTDFEDLVRRDSRWQYTDNAREQVSGIVASLAQTFGELA